MERAYSKRTERVELKKSAARPWQIHLAARMGRTPLPGQLTAGLTEHSPALKSSGLEGDVAALLIADADGVLGFVEEDFAVAGLACVGALDDGFDDRFDAIVCHDRL